MKLLLLLLLLLYINDLIEFLYKQKNDSFEGIFKIK